MSDNTLTVEELQAKLEASSRINAELIEREKNALAELSTFKEAEAAAAAAKAEADKKAAFEQAVQAEVAKQLAAKDSLGSIPVAAEEEPAETEEPKQEPNEVSESEARIEKLANRLKI